MTKPLKVLVFSYYWPPAGGPGVQRWLYFAKYLAEFGVQSTLVVPHGAQYPQLDDALMAEIPTDVRVHRVSISEPYRWISWLFPQSTKNLSRGIVPKKTQSNPAVVALDTGKLLGARRSSGVGE